jgi:hypothetical protein
MNARSLPPGGFSIWSRWLVLLLGLASGAWLLLAAPGPPDGPALPLLPRAPYGDVAIAGTLANSAIGEASGLAPSRVSPNVLWVLNDSGNAPELFAIGTNGAALATCRIEKVRNVDWEDLASFRLAEVPYLLIADTGDNGGKREDCALLVVREPREKERAAGRTLDLPVAWTLRFRYEDGPRDCESVAVDVAAGRVLLLSKRTKPPVLYELPLLPGTTGAVQVARRVIAVASMPPRVKSRRRGFWAQPTAMDIASDGTALAVLTYLDAYLYERRADEDWAQALRRAPQRIALPPEDDGILKQREALCFADGSRRLYVTAEGRHAQVGRLDWACHPPSVGKE